MVIERRQNRVILNIAKVEEGDDERERGVLDLYILDG